MLDLPDPSAAAAAATDDDRPVATASWRPTGTRSIDRHVTAEIASFAERQGMNSLGCEIVRAAIGFAVRHAIHSGASGPFAIDAAADERWLSVAVTDLGAAARAMPAVDAGLRLVSDELRTTANGGSPHTVLTEFAIR
jgi:hypothetical protein